jgi:hypothetical protein
MSRTGSSAWRYTRVASSSMSPDLSLHYGRHAEVHTDSSVQADRLLERTCARLGALAVGGVSKGRLGAKRVVKRKDPGATDHKNEAEAIVADVEEALQRLQDEEAENEEVFAGFFGRMRNVQSERRVCLGFEKMISHYEEYLDRTVDLSELSRIIHERSEELEALSEEMKRKMEYVTGIKEPKTEFSSRDKDIWAKAMREYHRRYGASTGGGDTSDNSEETGSSHRSRVPTRGGNIVETPPTSPRGGRESVEGSGDGGGG